MKVRDLIEKIYNKDLMITLLIDKDLKNITMNANELLSNETFGNDLLIDDIDVTFQDCYGNVDVVRYPWMTITCHTQDVIIVKSRSSLKDKIKSIFNKLRNRG